MKPSHAPAHRGTPGRVRGTTWESSTAKIGEVATRIAVSALVTMVSAQEIRKNGIAQEYFPNIRFG